MTRTHALAIIGLLVLLANTGCSAHKQSYESLLAARMTQFHEDQYGVENIKRYGAPSAL